MSIFSIYNYVSQSTISPVDYMLNHKNKSKSDIVIHCNYFKDNFSMKYSGYNVQDPHLQIISRIMQFRQKTRLRSNIN